MLHACIVVNIVWADDVDDQLMSIMTTGCCREWMLHGNDCMEMAAGSGCSMEMAAGSGCCMEVAAGMDDRMRKVAFHVWGCFCD